MKLTKAVAHDLFQLVPIGIFGALFGHGMQENEAGTMVLAGLGAACVIAAFWTRVAGWSDRE